MHAQGTKYYLKERKIEAVNAQSARLPHKLVVSGKASDCKVTRPDGTTYTIKAGKSKRQARKIAKVAAHAVQTDNLALLKMCGNIGDSNH